MSRSNPNEDARTPNPAGKFYQWSGDEGNLNYYDKKAEKKIEVKLPFTFLPISRLVTVKGYDDDSKTSYWSNEVKDISKDGLIVQSVTGGKGNKKISTVAKGLYKDIKPTLDSLDIKYVESLYIGVKGEKGLELCNFQIKGSAIGTWIPFCKDNKIWEIAVKIASTTAKKKGKVNYQEPVYTAINKISEAMQKEAIALDLQLNEYLAGYFERNKTDNSEVEEKPTKEKEAFDDSKHKDAQHSKKTTSKAAEVVEEEEEEDPDINFGNPNAPDEF